MVSLFPEGKREDEKRAMNHKPGDLPVLKTLDNLRG